MSKGNGKDIPPIAEVAEVLAAVNERMTQGMNAEAVFVSPPRALSWAPKEDITTYELARAVAVLLVAFAGQDALAMLDMQAPEVKRHFAEPEDEAPNESA